MKYELTTIKDRAAAVLKGELVATDRKEFDDLVSQLMAKASGTVVVDLKSLSYMDSAGLGMLLSLRERASGANATVVLAQSTGDVKELLELACFNTLFAFE